MTTENAIGIVTKKTSVAGETVATQENESKIKRGGSELTQLATDISSRLNGEIHITICTGNSEGAW